MTIVFLMLKCNLSICIYNRTSVIYWPIWELKMSLCQACQGRTRRSFRIRGKYHMARPARICIRLSTRGEKREQFRGRLKISLAISICNRFSSFVILHYLDRVILCNRNCLAWSSRYISNVCIIQLVFHVNIH